MAFVNLLGYDIRQCFVIKCNKILVTHNLFSTIVVYMYFKSHCANMCVYDKDIFRFTSILRTYLQLASQLRVR